MDLKPCPFCGSADLSPGWRATTFSIGCDACGFEFEGDPSTWKTELEQVKRECITRWNTRPVEDTARAEVERLRDALEPILHWYQSDEEPDRSTYDILRDVVSDLEMGRSQLLSVQRIAKRVVRDCEAGSPVSVHTVSASILAVISGSAALRTEGGE
jgi:hypothetical protein